MSRLQCIVGGQFGSEAKGAVTAKLARMARAEGDGVIAVRTAGHNAGHTAYSDSGRKFALRTIPVAMVADPEVIGVIAAGSEVNPDVLVHEIQVLESAGIDVRDRLYVDTSATWLTDEHIAREGGLQMHEKSGSTAKGVGAARADRIMRTAETIGRWNGLNNFCVPHVNTAGMLNRLVDTPNTTVLLEGTQGYGLGVHTPHYPLTTSSDCRAIDFLAMAGINPTIAETYEVWVVLRQHPIRVAGPSGELKGETTWEELGLKPELTTVTNKIRRVGGWDGDLAREAVAANGGERFVRIAYTMADQAMPWIAGMTDLESATPEQVAEYVARVHKVEADASAPVRLVGTGPQTMIEVQ